MNYLVKKLRRVRFLKIVKNIAENYMNGLFLKAGRRNFNAGSTHMALSTRESVSYINKVFDDYLRHANIGADYLKGKRVLEIGPGDNLGVAMLFVANGAAEITCIDRIYSSRNREQQAAVYRALRDGLDSGKKRNLDLGAGKIIYRHGVDIGRAVDAVGEKKFDIIVSRAVLEHVYEPDKAFLTMDRMLEKNGYLIHKVDLRDHGMFTMDGFGPLTFLTISEPVWGMMTKYSGKPNRKRSDFYESILGRMGYDYKILVTHVIIRNEEFDPPKQMFVKGRDYRDEDLELIRQARPALAEGFKRISDETLLVDGIFIVARKISG